MLTTIEREDLAYLAQTDAFAAVAQCKHVAERYAAEVAAELRGPIEAIRQLRLELRVLPNWCRGRMTTIAINHLRILNAENRLCAEARRPVPHV